MKKILWAIGLFGVLSVGYVASGPFLTVWAIQTAIAEQDTEKLSENVEFPTLRQNVKEQMNAAMMKNVTEKMGDNPFSALAAGFAAKMVEGMVDSLVTPNGLAAFMEGKKPSQKTKEAVSTPPDKGSLFSNAKFSYDSTSRFSVRVPDDQGREVRFVLQRKGLSWKLVNVIIPMDGRS